MIYTFFDKKPSDTSTIMETGINFENQKLAEKLRKLIIGKFRKHNVYYSFKDNLWGTYLADMQLISKYNKRIIFLLFFIDIYSKFSWAVPLKDKKGIKITNEFRKFLNESNCKRNKT